MRSIWEKYYAEAHGMIFVIDSADVGRFEEARLAFGKFLVSLHRRSLVGVGNPLTACLPTHTDAVRQHEELSGIPVMLLANKQDLPVRPS